MRTHTSRGYDSRVMTKTVRSLASRTWRFFSPETRAVLRQNAIRRTIASLIETERMRLALMIGNRHES